MTTTRLLPAVLAAALAVSGPALGQFRMPPYAQPGGAAPATPNLPAFAPPPALDPNAPAPKSDPSATLNRLATPIPSGESSPVDTLTSPPGLPPGSYASPWYSDAAGCFGPVGRNGPISYEVYWQTGPVIPFGSGPFTDRLHVGWNVGGGGRSLFFNKDGSAAWAIDLGLNYTYNRGSNDNFVDLETKQLPLQGANNTAIAQPDLYHEVRIRGLSRTAFQFGIGRDWFMWGTGMPGAADGWNFRIGTDVGGRWGTAHVDMVPLDDPGGYSRRQAVFHGTYLGLHTNLEFPLGGMVGFFGSRVEWSYDWMNIVPPIKGDVQNINLLFSGGVRF
ncbi:MAG TPA: hypothetical protein VGL71_00130 [Urbifossiella sp.]